VAVGFVGQDQQGLVARDAHRHALLLSAAHLVWAVVSVVAKVNPFEKAG